MQQLPLAEGSLSIGATQTPASGSIPVLGQPDLLLKLEGLVLLAAALLLYVQNRGEWVPFLALLLVPDLAMLGYLIGPAVGAALYNLLHNYLPPAALAAYGLLGASHWALLVRPHRYGPPAGLRSEVLQWLQGHSYPGQLNTE